MKIPFIDWNDIWKRFYDNRHDSNHDPQFWNKRAPSFAQHILGSPYTKQFIDIMKPDPSWSILDIGCAAGTLAVPLSPLVNSITAVDPSTTMLSLLHERCKDDLITNIRTVNGGWEDDWDMLDIGIYDVAIASRSLLIRDLKWAVLKLESHAKKRVYLSTLVDDGPHNRLIIEAVGRKFYERADYIIVYNLLRQMGYYPNVAFTVNNEDQVFNDIEDAVNSLRWMLHDMTDNEEADLKSYLQKILVQSNTGLKLPYPRTVRWAVIWWEK